jgi:hypothetical protein
MSGIRLLFTNLSEKGLNRTEMRGITESVTGGRNKESRPPRKESRLSISDPSPSPQTSRRTERTSSVALISTDLQGESSKAKDFSSSCRLYLNL